MKSNIRILIAVGVAVGCGAGLGCNRQQSKAGATPAEITIDGYSFAVGVWYARGAIRGGLTNQDEIMLAARQYFSQTNGWPKFNHR
jgi:hypothetical protein